MLESGISSKSYWLFSLPGCIEKLNGEWTGTDSGFKHIGFSVITERRELISGEAVIRTDIPKLNQEKAMYRRNRRNKLWYRQPRFMNRGNKKEGWFAPSIDHKLYGWSSQRVIFFTEVKMGRSPMIAIRVHPLLSQNSGSSRFIDLGRSNSTP